MAESGAHDVCTCTYSNAELFQTENFKERKLSIEFPSSTPGGKMQNFPRFLPQYFLPRDSFLFSVEENVANNSQICSFVVIFAVSNTRFWTIFAL
jgi:hypothetical protein